MGAEVSPLTSQEAATKLARLIERELGYDEGHVSAIALRLFIKAHWSKVSLYSHRIHDDTAAPPATYSEAK